MHEPNFTRTFYGYLFDIHPELKPLSTHTNLSKQESLLLDFLAFFTQNLSNPDLLIAHLKGLGARHVKYGVRPEYYPLFGSALLNTFTQYFKKNWTEELDQAWLDAYHAITALMLAGAEYDPEVLLIKKNSKEISEKQSYSPEELIQISFSELKPSLQEFVRVFYKNLFVSYPEITILFTNTFMIKQEKVLITSLCFVVKNLTKPELLEAKLKGLGARHIKYRVLPEYYPLFSHILLKTLAQYLKGNWTVEVERAWLDSYNLITSLMLQEKE
ncbi:MAG: globin domain-containing protein [Spirulinaceae cyanobacterium]